MIKSIKPGRLAGLSDEAIADRLSSLMDCIVDYEDGVAKIRCISDYGEEDSNGEVTYARLERAMRLLTRVGRTCISCDAIGPFVKLEFNAVAMDVISGERARREAAKKRNQTDSEHNVIQ